MATWFLLFVALLVALLAAGITRYLPRGYRTPALIGLAGWIIYGGALGYGGVLANTSVRPPGLFYLMAPIVMLVMFMARSRVGLTLATSIPLWLLAGAQTFRLLVEVFLHRLWLAGLLPKMLTFHGANFDILIGASAPLLAWLLATRKISDRGALVWNVVGIALLANVALRGVLSTAGALHLLATEVPNTAIVTFPYTFIPALMVPLALLLHVLSIRALRNRMRSANLPGNPADAKSIA